jgi:hypothetical protein
MAEGRQRADWGRASAAMALQANCHRDPKRRAQPFRAADFDPYAEQAAKKREPDFKADISVLKMFLPKGGKGGKRKKKG